MIINKCKQCGAALEDNGKNQKVCKHCGVIYDEEKSISNTTIINNYNDNKRKSKFVSLIVVASIFVFLGIAIAIWLLTG